MKVFTVLVLKALSILRSTSVSWVNALWRTSTWTSQCLVRVDVFPLSVRILLSSCVPLAEMLYVHHSECHSQGFCFSSSTECAFYCLQTGEEQGEVVYYLTWSVMSFIKLLRIMCFQVHAPGTTKTVYDNWIQYFNRTSPNYGIIPKYALIIPQYYLMFIAPWLVKY